MLWKERLLPERSPDGCQSFAPSAKMIPAAVPLDQASPARRAPFLPWSPKEPLLALAQMQESASYISTNAQPKYWKKSDTQPTIIVAAYRQARFGDGSPAAKNCQRSVRYHTHHRADSFVQNIQKKERNRQIKPTSIKYSRTDALYCGNGGYFYLQAIM